MYMYVCVLAQMHERVRRVWEDVGMDNERQRHKWL